MVLTKNERKIILYLWRNQKLQLSINELAKQVQVTPKGTHKILKKLEQENLIKQEKIANATISKLNLNNPATKNLVQYILKSEQPNLTAKEIIKKIEQNKAVIKSFGVKKLILFGSYARNEARTDSDIDFLVEFKKNRGLFDDFIHLQHLLEDLFNKEIDLGKPSLVRKELKENILGGKKIEAQI
jgi:hypothetical protein